MQPVIVTATFEDGVLKPTTPLSLPEHAQVRLTVELLHAEIQKAWDATKEQRLAALESSLRLAKPMGEHLTRDQLHERR
ncbi:MAG TPA: antitoxin family protein [Gemmataceae bacterium]|nr:antitoxin family protein [Gemmataceae bacterium]